MLQAWYYGGLGGQQENGECLLQKERTTAAEWPSKRQGGRIPARKGRNPATGEEIKIKASKASKKVAFRVAKGLSEAI